jgi:WD40 repeat protein
MLNCGFGQQDLSDLHPGEMDWEHGHFRRKRSKTGHHARMPAVDYLLWDATFTLLIRYRSTDPDHVLLTESGRTCERDAVQDDGSRGRTDAIQCNYRHLQVSPRPPLKLFRKTSSTLLPDGRTLAAGDRRGAAFWDARSGERRADLLGHYADVESLAFSPDGKTLAASGEDRTVKLWDLALKRPRATLRGHDRAVLCLAYAPGGGSVASGDEGGAVKVWDAVNGTPVAVFVAHASPVTSLTFSPDGGTIATGSGWGDSETTYGEVKFWDARDGTPRDSPPGPPAPSTRSPTLRAARRSPSALTTIRSPSWTSPRGGRVPPSRRRPRGFTVRAFSASLAPPTGSVWRRGAGTVTSSTGTWAGAADVLRANWITRSSSSPSPSHQTARTWRRATGRRP